MEILIRVFLVGLLVQFFLQTFVTYTLHLTGSFRDGIWLWKEACILIFVGFVGYGLWKHVQNNANLTRKSLRSDALFSFFVTFLILGVLSFIIAIGIQR